MIFSENWLREEPIVPEPTNIHPYTAWTMVTNSNHLMLQGDLNLSSEYLHTYDGVKNWKYRYSRELLISYCTHI